MTASTLHETKDNNHLGMSSSSEDASSRASSRDSSRHPSLVEEATTTESLVSHLLAAKRSLSSINHVLRANEIVTSTRTALEENVITVARTDFLRSGIDEQVKILEQAQGGSQRVERTGKDELDHVMKSVQEADQRLKGTLQSLRDTFVESGLRPIGEEKKKNLLDFVDESGVQTLVATIKESVQTAGKGHEDFADTNRAFAEETLNVKKLLRQRNTGMTVHDANDIGTQSPFPDILDIMEDHATEMADNLESLVKHFDLCVLAIKHTEGGDDTAHRLAVDLPEGVAIGEDLVNANPEPISKDERNEMISVIQKDAEQVDEVVSEMRSHIAEMESQHELLMEHVNACDQDHRNTMSAFRQLEDIGQRLPAFVAQSQVFLMRWDEERARIDERMEELEGLREFYDGYLTAYDNLLIEIGRRKALEMKVGKIVQDTLKKLDRLYETDTEVRDAFKKEQGDFLPIDIWPGMAEGPMKYKLSPVGTEGSIVPEIPESVIQQAIERVTRNA